MYNYNFVINHNSRPSITSTGPCMTTLMFYMEENFRPKPAFILVFITFMVQYSFISLFKTMNKDLHIRPIWSKKTSSMQQPKNPDRI